MLEIFDGTFKKTKLVLGPGEYHASGEDLVLSTVLGSCVAVCLRDTVKGVAGMNHFLLPNPLKRDEFFRSDSGRFGIHAMELLINAILEQGGRRTKLVAKVFGGGHVLPSAPRLKSIPDANVEFALAFLDAESIPVAARDVGGSQGRRISMEVSTGMVFVRKLRDANTKVVPAELSYLQQAETRGAGDVTLFDDAKTIRKRKGP